MKKIKKFTTLSMEEKKLFVEAYVTLGVMRFALLTRSFKHLTRSLTHEVEKTDLEKLKEKEILVARSVGKAIARATKYTPWESACLVQSFTAQKMLQKRGISGVFYLGAMKDSEEKNKMKAHAWSQCGNMIVTGKNGHEGFTVLSVFKW